MGALVAAVSKDGKTAVPKVLAMLRKLRHRGMDAHGVATTDSVSVAKSIEEIMDEKLNSSIALGHNLSKFLSRDHPQPVQCEGFTLVFEGRWFSPPAAPEVEEIAKKLKRDPSKNAKHVIDEFDGSYAFAVALPHKVIAGRDALGVCPLYYGENETTCGVASERKALWAIGINSVRSFPPGNLAVVNAQGFSFKSIKPLTQPPLRPMEMEAAAEHLRSLLLKSTNNRVSDLEKVAVAFSGGLDSSVIAMLAKVCGARICLISVGLEDQAEVRFAEEAAEALGLRLHLETYTLDDVETVLSRVLWLIEEPDVMKAGVAVPLYWAAEVASRMGYRVLLTGQGGDELFGGYHRYLREYTRKDVAAVREAMYRDVVSSHEVNFQRDNQVCSFHGVELRLLFTDREVVNFALSLPVGLNIASADDRLRKRVLRKTAQLLGLPDFIVNKIKKAIQYATGVDKALRKLAKNEGLALQKYIKEKFEAV